MQFFRVDLMNKRIREFFQRFPIAKYIFFGLSSASILVGLGLISLALILTFGTGTVAVIGFGIGAAILCISYIAFSLFASRLFSSVISQPNMPMAPNDALTVTATTISNYPESSKENSLSMVFETIAKESKKIVKEIGQRIKDPRTNAEQDESAIIARNIINAALFGLEGYAKAFLAEIRRNPKLLLMRFTQEITSPLKILNYNYERPVVRENVTLLQLVFGSGNYQLCYLMDPYFIKACGNEERAKKEIKAQLDEKFPKVNFILNAQAEREFNVLLNRVGNSITNDDLMDLDEKNKRVVNNETLLSINNLRDKIFDIHASQREKGMHFCSKLLRITCNYYNVVQSDWRVTYSAELRQLKCALFEDAVISFLLLFLSENDAKHLAHGLINIDQGKFSANDIRRCITKGNIGFYKLLSTESPDFDIRGVGLNFIHGQFRNQGSGATMQLRPSIEAMDENAYFTLDNYFDNQYKCLTDYYDRQQPSQVEEFNINLRPK